MASYNIRIIGGTGNPQLSADVVTILGLQLEDAIISTFSDGETRIQLHENIRGEDVYIIQPMAPPHVNDNVMQLLLLAATVKSSSAKRVNVVVPYYGYARQDQKVKPRVPISAAVVAQLLSSVSIDRVITVDLHCGQIQGFFPTSIAVDNLFAETYMVKPLKECVERLLLTASNGSRLVVVSPDAGGVSRANRIADLLQADSVATILKRRTEPNKIASMEMVGDVSNAICVIADDMIDTGGTLCKAASMLKDHGAKTVIASATHGVFSGNAMGIINSSVLYAVFITDTLPQAFNVEKCPKLCVVSIAPLLAAAISRCHKEESLSGLFFK